MNEPKLTDELARGILAAIRAGAFPHVAAAAYGVHLALWDRWLRRGRRKDAREPYRSFVRRVEEAEAQARLRAEVAALEKDARGWLKHGPGRDLPGRPGWAALVRPAPPPEKHAVRWLASPEFAHFFALLRAALAPFPEALAAVERTFDGEAPAAGT